MTTAERSEHFRASIVTEVEALPAHERGRLDAMTTRLNERTRRREGNPRIQAS